MMRAINRLLRGDDSARPADPKSRNARSLTRWIGPLLIVGALAAATYVFDRELRHLRYHDLVRAVRALPQSKILAAVALALAAYAVLPGYDAIALHVIGRPLPLHRVAFGSFIAYAMSQTLGFPLLTGGSVRYRFWTSWGLTSGEVAAAMSVVAMTFTVGLLAVGGMAMVLEPTGTATLVKLPAGALTWLGVACLVIVAGYVALCGLRRKPLALLRLQLPLPSFRWAVAQLVVAAVDWTLAGLVLFVLLPSAPALTVPIVLGAFLMAQLVGLASHLPGGIGVFDGLIVLLLGPRIDASALVASLIAFRVIYYLIPFAIGLILLLASELVRQRVRVKVVADRAGWAASLVAGRWLPSLLPYVLSGAAFFAGVLLLFSSATPPGHARISWLHHVLPLGVIEASHFVGSVAGGGLIVLGWALSRRLDAAYHLTRGLLAVGVVASLLKGLDWEPALALSVVLALLLPARRYFYRRTALTAEPFSPGWTVAIVAVLGLTTWLVLFSYRHVTYSSELWWRFSIRHGAAPRSLRAIVGLFGTVATFAFARLFRAARAALALPTEPELARAAAIASTGAAPTAQLALVGDKAILFSESGRGFLMYGISGRSWVAMGDPVGPPEDQRELCWRFREAADRHGAWPVFYEVTPERLPLYLELGLTIQKLGEDAIVPLADFSLDGPERRGLRRSHRDLVRRRATFEVLPPDRVAGVLDELRQVSDEWLEEKRTREKGFSLGRFDDRYLSRLPLATVRLDGQITAFANLWLAAAAGELSMDLMRYRANAPRGVMEFLFVEMMLWGRAQGYARFNLGMAPLAGLESRALAPLWARAGAFLYRHGEQFYNFQGLRHYKEKFDPIWRPRYLACPGGLALPRILANIATLISGGLAGVVGR